MFHLFPCLLLFLASFIHATTLGMSVPSLNVIVASFILVVISIIIFFENKGVPGGGSHKETERKRRNIPNPNIHPRHSGPKILIPLIPDGIHLSRTALAISPRLIQIHRPQIRLRGKLSWNDRFPRRTSKSQSTEGVVAIRHRGLFEGCVDSEKRVEVCCEGDGRVEVEAVAGEGGEEGGEDAVGAAGAAARGEEGGDAGEGVVEEVFREERGESHLEKRFFRRKGFGFGVGDGGVKGVDFDGCGAICFVGPVEAGEMFGDVPVFLKKKFTWSEFCFCFLPSVNIAEFVNKFFFRKRREHQRG